MGATNSVADPGVKVAAELDERRPRSSVAADGLAHEPRFPTSSVRRPFALARVEHFSGVGSGRQHGVVVALAGVAIGGDLLGMPVHLTDRRVDVDDARRLAGARAGGGRAREHRFGEPVELTDMAEREPAQPRSDCRRGRDVAANSCARWHPGSEGRHRRCSPRRPASRAPWWRP